MEVRSEVVHICILHNIASSFHCHTCWLEFKMLLPPVKKQKTLACVREIGVHKLRTQVDSQQGLAATELRHKKINDLSLLTSSKEALGTKWLKV